MSKQVKTLVKAVGLTFVCTDHDFVYCEECMSKESGDFAVRLKEAMLSGQEIVEFKYTSILNVYTGGDSAKEFVDSRNWQTKDETRWAWLYRFEEHDDRRLADRVRSIDVFKSGREVKCGLCEKRLFQTRRVVEVMATIEYHEVKIF